MENNDAASYVYCAKTHKVGDETREALPNAEMQPKDQ